MGLLVSKLGLGEELAFAIVSALTGSGAALVGTLWPFVAPFLLTLNGIIAFSGTAAGVGY
ncbi:hypothetical protein SAMN04488113_12714 [Alkalibacterium gilvum]|uniref:Uncharacterized protein n=1 Tax=Alkalibacterium gilvum TaxID=1130080 RepID=A0A1H6U3J1_9LACT|nr:hypothetical protein [Alkalibacterium gilvum]SEI86841.1 hypothetical protein SAMN04488113_12714 [Alkalibacterium gilvum]